MGLNMERIQRRIGEKMPPHTVYIGRGSKYGNPYVIGKDGTAEECVRKYAEEMMPYRHDPPHNGMDELFKSEAFLKMATQDLRGKNLACWCRLDQPCHGDWLEWILNV